MKKKKTYKNKLFKFYFSYVNNNNNNLIVYLF